jgi:hypothetical protein
MAKPRTIYLLRKSSQGAEEAIPVLTRTDLPLRFHFQGKEVEITASNRGRLQITTRLTGTTNDQA